MDLVDGVDVDVIAYTVEGGRSLSVLVDRDTALPIAIEYLLDFPLLGDVTVRWTFLDYRHVSGLGLYPSGHRVTLDGHVFQDIRYSSVVVDGASRPYLFELPGGIAEPAVPTERSRPSDPPQPRVLEVADGVFYLENARPGLNAMFLERVRGLPRH